MVFITHFYIKFISELLNFLANGAFKEIKKTMASFKNYSKTIKTNFKLPLKTSKNFVFTLYLQFKFN